MRLFMHMPQLRPCMQHGGADRPLLLCASQHEGGHSAAMMGQRRLTLLARAFAALPCEWLRPIVLPRVLERVGIPARHGPNFVELAVLRGLVSTAINGMFGGTASGSLSRLLVAWLVAACSAPPSSSPPSTSTSTSTSASSSTPSSSSTSSAASSALAYAGALNDNARVDGAVGLNAGEGTDDDDDDDVVVSLGALASSLAQKRVARMLDALLIPCAHGPLSSSRVLAAGEFLLPKSFMQTPPPSHSHSLSQTEAVRFVILRCTLEPLETHVTGRPTVNIDSGDKFREAISFGAVYVLRVIKALAALGVTLLISTEALAEPAGQYCAEFGMRAVAYAEEHDAAALCTAAGISAVSTLDLRCVATEENVGRASGVQPTTLALDSFVHFRGIVRRDFDSERAASVLSARPPRERGCDRHATFDIGGDTNIRQVGWPLGRSYMRREGWIVDRGHSGGAGGIVG